MTNQERIAELKAEIAALEQDSFFEDQPAPVVPKRRSKGKPWSHYQEMRRKNPHQYYQAATQKELLASREALGDAFFKE